MSTVVTTAYHDPDDVDEALELLADLGDNATVIAGGQDVVREMNRGERAPSNIVDVSGLAALDEIDTDGDTLRIGPLVTHEALADSERVAEAAPLLLDAKATIGGGQQIHNRGTVGGAICAGQPVYDYPPCLVALDATLVLESADGTREVAADEFFQGAAETARAADELLTGIRVPRVPGETGYEKLKYTEGCYNIASAAAVVNTRDGHVADARLALGGVEPIPRRLAAAETRITGERFSDDLAAAVGELASEAVEDPITDVHADAGYREDMAAVVTKRAVTEAARRARTATDGGSEPMEGSR